MSIFVNWCFAEIALLPAAAVLLCVVQKLNTSARESTLNVEKTFHLYNYNFTQWEDLPKRRGSVGEKKIRALAEVFPQILSDLAPWDQKSIPCTFCAGDSVYAGCPTV